LFESLSAGVFVHAGVWFLFLGANLCDRIGMIDGWLFQIVMPGFEPVTRRMTSWWASWHGDQSEALKAVTDQIGSCKPYDSRTLTEQQLKLMGLASPGDVMVVKNEF
jgi:hypothetical protein